MQDLDLDARQLSLLTRRSGSGSACRSIPTGFVEWVVPDGPLDPAAWDAQSCPRPAPLRGPGMDHIPRTPSPLPSARPRAR